MTVDDTTTRPNVLVVMTDQQRFDTIRALGNELIATPNLDRLVGEGVAFTNAYTSAPECLPARYSLMAGTYPTGTDAWMNWTDDGLHESARTACGPWLPELMAGLGYRTFGVGKFHTVGWDAALGFDVDLRSEELYATPEQRARDAYASFIATDHPEYAHVEQLMGERSEMYYVPQMNPLPADLNQEAWAAARVVEQLTGSDDRPFFGVLSFVGPHPPLAPPVPFNRMYDPDRMPARRLGDPVVDRLDRYLAWSNHSVYAEDVSDELHRVITARYYGEITYIDRCLGRVLDALDARDDVSNTLVIFTSDHGEHLGDHHAWQKQSFFEASVRVPFVLRWPARVSGGSRSDALVGLVDLLATATAAAGASETRDGLDAVAVATGEAPGHDTLLSFYGMPGTPLFKLMVRRDAWKYVFLANGGHEVCFDIGGDPDELTPIEAPVVDDLRAVAIEHLRRRGVTAALGDDGGLRSFPSADLPPMRIVQLDASRGVTGFPAAPDDLLAQLAR